MADNVLGSVQIKIVGDATQLEYDLRRAENAAKAASANMAQAMFRFGTAAQGGSQTAISALQKAEARLISTRNEAARLAAAFAKIKPPELTSFVGAIPGMGVAAERFIKLIPGLGQAMISAYPLFGAVAFAEGIGRIAAGIHELAQEWDPVISAEKRATEQAEKFSQEISKVRKELQDIADTNFGEMFGPSALQAFQAGNLNAQIQDLKVKISMAQYGAANPRGGTGALMQGVASVGAVMGLPGAGMMAERMTKGAKIDAATQTRDLVVMQSQLRKLEELQEQFSRRSAKEQDKTNDTAADKAKKATDKAAQRDREGWEARYRIFEEALREVQAARDKDIEDEKRYQEALAEQKQRWAKINIDAKDERVRQSKIDVPLETQVAGPMATALELGRAGVATVQARQAAIAEDQRLLNMAQAMNVPIGTQLQMRQRILEEQIALKEAQGQSTSAELQELDAIDAKLDQMRVKSQGIAPMLHGIRQIGGTIPGHLGGALASGITGGSPGKSVGQEIRGALQGIGREIMGTVFQAAIQRLVISLGLNTLANTLLKFVFGGAAAVQAANTAAVVANTVGQGVLAVSNTALVASNVALTSAIAALTAVTAVDAAIPFADGGRPPLGVPSIVGENGPEMFVPDQAGKIVPNHQLQGGAGLMLPMAMAMSQGSIGSINFNAHGVTSREFVRQVAKELPGYLKSTSPKFSPAAR